MVAPCRERLDLLLLGTGVRPSMRPRMTDWLTFGSVLGFECRCRAAERRHPRQTSYARPSLSSLHLLCVRRKRMDRRCADATVCPAFAQAPSRR